MAVIGSIIKAALNIRETLSSEPDNLEAQKEVLKNLLETAKNTAFGKHYRFDTLLRAPDIKKAFAEKIPIFDYNKINQQWLYRIHQGEEDVTWKGNPRYFALSSGTTGKTSKRIPVTDEMLSSIKQAGVRQVEALSNFDLPAEFFEKEMLMLGSCADLKQINGHLEGEISGISAGNIPFWFQGYYRPGHEIAKIEDWEERVQRIAEKAPDWDIGALCGIPAWIELMLQKVISHNGLKNIHEIWPNLEVFASGGVAFKPYEKSFAALLDRPIQIIDTYFASEGFIAIQERPETDAMKLLLSNGIYYEFVPFKPEYIKEDGSVVPGAPVVSLGEVEQGKEYVLLVSTVAGLWRYVIGDTVEFTDVEKAEIKITGRTKFFMNVVGSQLSVNKMDEALFELEKHFDIAITEYTMAAVRMNNQFYHKWYMGIDTEADETALAEKLDELLKAANKNYGVARSKALKGVIVKAIPSAFFYEWNARNKKKGGQVKMERVMNEEKFTEWEHFVEEQNVRSV